METSKVKNQDLPAFASVAISGNDGYQQDGLTKREYFAVLAMQGLITNAPNGHLSNSKEGVRLALQWADELLKQLEE